MTARTDLEAQLHGPVPALNQLSDAEAADVLGLVDAARRQERSALSQAIDGMVEALPKPLRGVTKKIMFGDAAG